MEDGSIQEYLKRQRGLAHSLVGAKIVDAEHIELGSESVRLTLDDGRTVTLNAVWHNDDTAGLCIEAKT